jgi:ATP/maltotriose-dependent transcriptional regulator MalT
MDWSDKGIIYCKQRKLEAGLILANRLQGEAALGLKDLKLAEDRLAYAIAEARAVIFVEEELAALIALAELRRQQGDLDTARALLEDVWHAAEHGPYRLFHADACNVLAYIERDTGNNDAAVQAALTAFIFSWCDGPPYAYNRGLMQAQTHLGVLDQPEPELEPFDPDDTMPMVAVDIDPKGETA